MDVVLCNGILKNLVGRIRPFDVNTSIQLLVARPHDYSFPSGHTAASFAAAVILFLQLPKKYGIPALILAVLISFSRLYLGVHYPTDVLAGAVSGTLIALAVHWIFEKKKEKHSENCE